MFNNGESFNSKLKVDIIICYLRFHIMVFFFSTDEDDNPVDGPAPPRGPPPGGPGNPFAVPPGAPGNTFYKGHL